ncbi:MAG: OmpP1/FadL family transporter [Parashewanella sp.]
MNSFNKTSLAIALALVSSQALSAGFQLNSQSASGMGRANSGDAAIGDNASVLARNPAAMSLFDKKSLSVGLTYVQPDVEVNDVTTNIDIGSVNNSADNRAIPNIYYIQPINDKMSFGAGIFSNFGTGTDTTALVNANPNKVLPVDLLGNTEVLTINFNASVSYKMNDYFTLGAGLDVIYGSGKLNREGNLPFGPNGALVPVKLVDVDADGVRVGGIIGALFEFNQNNRIGVSYRMTPQFKVSGDLNIFVPQARRAAAYEDLIIPLPDIFQVGGFHQLTDKFAFHYTAQFTKWGDFDQITLEDGKLGSTSVPNRALKEYKWQDSWLYSVGGTYQLTNNIAIRAGYLFDNSVVDQLTSISIPDSDRNWYTVGASYQIDPSSSVDFGFAIVRGKKTDINEASIVSGATTAHTVGHANYYSVQYNYSF